MIYGQRRTFSLLLEGVIEEAISNEVRAAYIAGYKEAAALYGRPIAVVQKAYEEADWKATAYLSERSEVCG